MAKTGAEDLVETVADRFHTYLRRGVHVENVIGAAHPELEIEDIETLLRIHFVLTESDDADDEDVGVLDFARNLEDQVRQVKTTTRTETSRFRGEIRGRVDWQRTTKARFREGRPDATVFVCERREEDYDVDENLVLKQLLAVIDQILTEDLQGVLADPERYPWIADWVDGDSETDAAIDRLRKVYRENIYLQRIDLEEGTVTDRMVERVRRSRNPLYRDAATLLHRYRSMMDGRLDSEESRKVLNNTLIRPEKTETLFELHWIFTILDAYDDVQFRLLDEDNPSVVARWITDDEEFVMYHDSIGEAARFDEPIPDEPPEGGYFQRSVEVLEHWQALTEDILGRASRGSLWGGRPDIVIERYGTDGQLRGLFLGEAKYTRSTDYIATGLRELLEYMAFAKDATDDEYIEADDDILDSESVGGVLFVDAVDGAQSDEDIEIFEVGQTPGKVL